MNNLLKHEQESSGWVINAIGNIHVDYFVMAPSVKTYGKYVIWSRGISGRHHVVHIQTKH